MGTRLQPRRCANPAIFVGFCIASILLFASCGGGGDPAPTVSAPGITISSASITYKSQLVGATSAPQTVTLTNSGNATLNIASLKVTGPNAADFVLTTMCGSSVAPGASCTATVTFQPSATGTRTASVNITDNSAGSPQTVALSGTGIAPAFTLSAASLDFGSQVVGAASAAQTETITNSGTADLTISTVKVGGANPSDFAISKDTCAGATVAPSGTCSVGVTFTPEVGGGRNGTLTFTDNATGSPHSVSLSGSGDNPHPSLTSLSPPSALAGAGALTLTLNGSDLLSTSTVTYNGMGHPATFVSASALTITLSAADLATAGSYAVVVTNPTPGGGNSTLSFPVNNPAPTLSSFSPAFSTVGAGALTLTLNGSNFLSTSTVAYNGVAHPATFVSASTLTITLSAADQATAGSFAVVVTNPTPSGGNSTLSFPVNNPVPTLSSFSPAFSTVGAAALTLTLNGSNFLSTSTVAYNGVAHPATFVSASTLTITLSAADQATAGSFAVVVTNPTPSGGNSTLSFPVNNPVPTLSSFSPAFSTVGAAALTLTLNGSNFLSTSTVAYNGVAHLATFVSASTLTITLSAADQATAGNYAVVVTNPTPGGGNSTLSFPVNNPALTLNSLSPASSTVGVGALTLTLQGSNFLSTSTVTYNGVAHAATYVSASALTITLSAADQVTAGSYAVVVTNPAPGGGKSTLNFLVNNPAPTLSSFSPASSTVGAGALTLTLQGSNFQSASTVTYNGAAHPATYVSASALTITLSAADQATAGSYAVVVTNPAPGGGSSTLSFPVNNAPPVITSATTASGTVGSAFSYQITATNTPASYGATGLPVGLTVNSGTGLISGTPTAAGTSTVTLSATNSRGTGTASLALTIAGGGTQPPIAHTIQISSDADDGYLQDGSVWYSTPTSGGADLVGSWAGTTTAYVTGYRFPSTGVNSGDTIRSAYLQLVSSDGSASSAVCGSAPCPGTNSTFRVYGVAQDDGPSFSGSTGNTPLDVPYTTAYTDYTTTGPGDVHGSCQGNNNGQNTCTHIIDVTSIVNEITARPGWTSTSAIRFVLLSTDNAAPNVYAGFEDYSANHSKAATLVVNPPVPTIVSSGAWGTASQVTYPTTYDTGPFVYPGASTLLLFLGDYYNFYSQPITQPTVSDSCGNTWNILAGPTNWVGYFYDMRSTVYYVQNPVSCPAGDTITITVDIQEPIFIHFLAVAGSNTAQAPIASAITSPSPGTYTTSATSSPITLPKAGLLVSWIFGDSDAPHTFTPQAGFITDPNSTPNYLTAVFESVSSPGSYQSQFSITPTSDGWQVVIIGLPAP